jgi:hypothetical protein
VGVGTQQLLQLAVQLQDVGLQGQQLVNPHLPQFLQPLFVAQQQFNPALEFKNTLL